MGGILCGFLSWISGNQSKVGVISNHLGSEVDLHQTNSPLTGREAAYLISTWELVKPDLKSHGIKFFILLFETHPYLQNKFKPFAGKAIEDLIYSKILAAHGTTVMSALDSYIENLNDVSVVVEMLKLTGQNHHGRGIQKEDFEVGLMPEHLGPEADVPDPDSSLTPRETAYITSTWAIVKTDLKTHGLKFFLLLFETHPHIQNQFKPFADVPIELLISSVSLTAHGMRVLKALDSYIENLDDVSVVVELLKINGYRHHSIGIDLKDFELTYEIILQYLGEALGPVFTKAAHAAWAHLLKVVHSILLKAYEERDEENES